MSNTKRIVTVGDVRDEKALADARKFAKADAKFVADRLKMVYENEVMARFPQIGMVQTFEDRNFYAFVNGYDTDPVKSTDIDKVVAAIEQATEVSL